MNIATLLRRAAADHAGQVALRLDDHELRYAHMADSAARFAAYLRAEGLAPGDRVAFFLPNALEYVPGLLGVWQAGGVGVPLNYLFPEAALRHAILDSGASHVVVHPGDAARLERIVAGEKVALLVTGPDGSLTSALGRHEPMLQVEPRLDVDDALLMYTSGSTGVPKGVRQTHRNTMAEIEATIDVYELTAEDRALVPMPLFHVGGLQLCTLPILLRGGEVTFMARWDVAAWIELAQRLRPTYGGLISTMLIDVGNRTAAAPILLDSFRVLMFGGSRTPSAPIDRLVAGIGVEPVEIYGQTEQSGLAVTYPIGVPRRPDSAGLPLDQIVATRLVPPDGGPDIRPGDDGVGELWVRGDAVTPGYWNRPGAEKWAEGWFRTGDLVSRDAEGYLYYVDRIDDMIVTGGENVFPQMVEEHLAGCPDLAEVAVIGTAHERWVQQVTAVVVPSRDGLTADEVAAWCATNPNLTGMHRPRRIEIVDALPRTGSGKLNRPELRRRYP
ncbi:MAG TPA: class I adenylate-forming enzyme family protein [Pseudonocardia sp.]